MKLSANASLRRSATYTLLTAACSLLFSTAQAADRVGDFSLLDQIGNSHTMSWYDDNNAIALLVQANSSAATNAALPQFIELQQKFTEQGIQFFMINPMGNLNRDAIDAQVSQHTTDIPVLMDDAQIISEALGIERIGEAILFDPKSFKVMFQGPLGSEFETAMANILNDEPVTLASVPMTSNELISYPQLRAVSYANDVAPVLAENCATCHREGGIAPFAMDSHAMAKGWSPMIREVLMTKRMPPGQVDPHVHKFTNGRTLAIQDAQNIVRWIDAGALNEGSSDPLAELTWPDSRWNVGSEPDLIVRIPAQEIPATGVLEYVHMQVPIVGMAKDRWLRASEFIPGDRTVVHHATGNIASGAGGRGRDPDGAVLNRYVPGAEPRIEPPNTGGLLKKDSIINVTMHYTTSGKEAVDESEFGLWFYPDDVVPQERMKARLIGNFTNDWETIPPYAKNFEVSNSFTLPEDVDVYQYHPHMHFRGKDLRMYADYPDGRRELLINVADYSYAWQLTYDLEQPIFLPAGTKITSIAHFDNSTQNLANPDPSRAVPWGEQSWDEMFFGEIIWKTAK